MKYVYVLESLSDPARHYVGNADDPTGRLIDHNAGRSPHTSKYVPWRIIVSIGFDEHQKAYDFERYLKSGSGRAFAKKHF
jgi:predicted GIY-YIG superfamily endonuclease